MRQHFKTIAIAAFSAILGATVIAIAAQTNYLGTVFIADTTTPTQQLKVNADGSINVSVAGQYPSGSTPITGNSTGTTGAVVGTLAATTGKTTYICGLNVSATGGTAAIGPITVAGTVTASLVFELNSTVGGNNLSENFSPCIPASATNTTITTTTTADGTASAVAVNSWGYQQ
jgi:hypothetical protein